MVNNMQFIFEKEEDYLYVKEIIEKVKWNLKQSSPFNWRKEIVLKVILQNWAKDGKIPTIVAEPRPINTTAKSLILNDSQEMDLLRSVLTRYEKLGTEKGGEMLTEWIKRVDPNWQIHPLELDETGEKRTANAQIIRKAREVFQL